MERHLLRGEDPDDFQVVMQDMADSLRQAMERLRQTADEMGIDLEAVSPAEEEPFDADEDPLCRRAWRWMEQVEALLCRVQTGLPALGDALLREWERGRMEPPQGALQSLATVRDVVEVLARYHTLVPVKTARAVGGQGEADAEEDAMIAGFTRDDALGTAKLTHACLKRSAAALWTVAEFHQPWLEAAMPCILQAEAIRQELRARFPGLEAFRRPGFDEE
jgi:hypothetical protein